MTAATVLIVITYMAGSAAGSAGGVLGQAQSCDVASSMCGLGPANVLALRTTTHGLAFAAPSPSRCTGSAAMPIVFLAVRRGPP